MLLTHKWLTPEVKQTWVSLPLFFTKLGSGMHLGFTSCFLAAIQEPDSDIKMDLDTSTWFVSAGSITGLIGQLFASIAMPRLGRRWTFVIGTVPAIIGQLLMFFTDNIPVLMIGRILASLTAASNGLIGFAVLGEYVSPKNRGMFLNLATAVMNVGSLIMHAVGHYTSWRMLALINAVPFIFCLIISYASPESPSWLAENKQEDKSREVFYWLRGTTEETTKEIEDLIAAQRHRTLGKTFQESIRDFFLKFKQNNFLKPLGITVVALILMETSGRHIFPSYASQLISEMIPSGVNTYYYNIVLDVLVIVSGMSSSYLIRVMRMRTLLFSTGAATAVVLTLASVSLYLVSDGVVPEDYSVASLVLFGLYIVLGNSGGNCLPVALCGELFPLEHKAVASLLYNCAFTLMMALVLKIVPYMIAAFCIYGMFLILAVCMGVALLVLYFVLPETTHKTLQEIQEHFKEKNHKELKDGESIQ